LILDRHTKAPSPREKAAGRAGIGRRINKQPVRSYGTDYSKETWKSRRLQAALSLKCTKPVPAIYMKLYKSTENALMKLTLYSENTLIKLYNYIEKYPIKLYNEMKSPDFIS